MNRFSAYLDNQKLARHWFSTAKERVKDKETEKAVLALVNACEYQMTACNNIASLYFERRKRK